MEMHHEMHTDYCDPEMARGDTVRKTIEHRQLSESPERRSYINKPYVYEAPLIHLYMYHDVTKK